MVDALGKQGLSDTASEDDLVRRAKAGDRRAMSILLVLLEPKVRAFIRRRWPEEMYEADGVDDLVQRTHQGAWEAMHQFRADNLREFKAWLFAVARNRMNYVVRHYAADKRRHQRVQLPADSDTTAVRLFQRIARTTRSPGFHARQSELVAKLREGIASLRERQQIILREHFGNGLTFREIAQKLDMKPDAVRQAALRAVRFLRDWLGDDGDRSTGNGHGRRQSDPPQGGLQGAEEQKQ